MNWIQVLVIAAVVALLVFLLRSRGSVQARAWVKVGYVVFVVAGIYAVLRPDDTTVLAHWLGVGRGTDLMLYALVVAFAFTSLTTYLHFKDVELRYTRLARAIALQSAQRPSDPA
jgi:small membrane protein